MWTIYVGGEQFVHCREVVHSSECPLSEVPLYNCSCCIVFMCVCVVCEIVGKIFLSLCAGRQ